MQEYTNCLMQVRHRLLFAANEQGLTVICISIWLHLFFISGFNLGVILQTSAKNIEDEHLPCWQTLLTTSLGRSSDSGIYFTEDLNSFAFQIEQLYRGLKAEIDEEVLSCHCCMCWRRSEMFHCGSSPVSEKERLCNRKWGGRSWTHAQEMQRELLGMNHRMEVLYVCTCQGRRRPWCPCDKRVFVNLDTQWICWKICT